MTLQPPDDAREIWRRTGNLLGFGLAPCAAAALVLQVWLIWPDIAGVDFIPLRHAAAALLNGRSIYSDQSFVYPPTAAIIVIPTTAGSVASAYLVWLCIGVTALLAASVMVGLASHGYRFTVVMLVMTIVAGASVTTDSLRLGNLSPVIAPFAVYTLLSFERRRWTMGCAVLAISLLIKPLLVPLLLLPLAKRQWRPILTAIVPAATFELLACLWVPGGSDLLRVGRYVVGGTNLHGDNARNNLSFAGWSEVHGHRAPVLALTLTVAALGLLALFAWVRGTVSPDDGAGAVRVGTVVMLAVFLCGRISEVHFLLTILLTTLCWLVLEPSRRSAMLCLPGLAGLYLPETGLNGLEGQPGTQSYYILAEVLLLLAAVWCGLRPRLDWTRLGEAMLRARWPVCTALTMIAAALARDGGSPDLQLFAQRGGLILTGHLSGVYDVAWNQAGPLQLIAARLLLPGDAVEPPLLTELIIDLALLWVLRTSCRRVRCDAMLEAALGIVAVLWFGPAGLWDGHPIELAIPLLWLLAASATHRRRLLIPAVALGMAVLIAPFAVVGFPLALVGAADRAKRLAIACVVAVIGYLPFAAAGRFLLFQHMWPVDHDSLVHLTFPGLVSFGWGPRLIQALVAVLGSAAVCARFRHRPAEWWIVPMSAVLIRIVIDPHVQPYYWLPAVVLVIHATLRHATDRRTTVALLLLACVIYAGTSAGPAWVYAATAAVLAVAIAGQAESVIPAPPRRATPSVQVG